MPPQTIPSRFSSLVLFLTAAALIAMPAGRARAFDRKDLPRIEKRKVFYERGGYALGASRLIVDLQSKPEEGKRHRSQGITVYYTTKDSYKSLFGVALAPPIHIEESEREVRLSSGPESITLSADGVRYEIAKDFPEGYKGWRFCWIELDRVRFDDATAYRNRDDGWRKFAVSCLGIKAEKVDSAPDKAAEWFAVDGEFKPDYALRTECGLLTLWDFELEADKVGGFYDRWNARLMNIGGGGTPAFYNMASKIAPGGKVRLTLRFRARPEKGYPLDIPKASKPALFDSHIHITTVTDLADSVRMARKYGYRYGLLSIYYREGEYGRHFTGDDHMFEAMERYPDVFVGFGLIQLNEGGFPGYRRQGPHKPEHVVELRRKGCLGLKTLVKWSKRSVQLDDPKYDPIWAKAEELRMPIVHHTEAEGTGSSHTRCANVAGRVPKLPVIMAHMARRGQLETTVKVLKKHPNLYIQHMHLWYARDESGTLALERLVKEGLAHKIVFGSDVQNDHSPLIRDNVRLRRELKELGVDDETIEGVMHGTLEKLLANVKPAPPEDAGR